MKMVINSKLSAVVLGLLCSTIAGCGYQDALNFDERLEVAVHGANFIGPSNSSAAGNSSSSNSDLIDRAATPKSLKLRMTGITAVDADGSTVDWFSKDFLDITVLDRPQLIYSVGLSDRVGDEFSNISVHFSPEISASDPAIKGELAESTVTLEQSFSVAKGKTARLTARLPWRNLIQKGEGGSPDHLVPVDILLNFNP